MEVRLVDKDQLHRKQVADMDRLVLRQSAEAKSWQAAAAAAAAETERRHLAQQQTANTVDAEGIHLTLLTRQQEKVMGMEQSIMYQESLIK